MIAFACVSVDERVFRSAAAPSIEAASESGSLLLRRHRPPGGDGPDRTDLWNELLAEASRRADLEALVLIREDVELEEARLCTRIRALLAADEEVAVIGSGGPPGATAAEARTVPGNIVVLSPWAAAGLSHDPRFVDSRDAAAADLCLTARERGKRVLSTPFGAICRSVSESPPARRRRLRAAAELARKWSLAASVPNHC